MQSRITAKINVVHPDAQIPKFQTEKAAGFDLAIVEDLTLYPGQSKNVGTGLVIQTPPDHMLLIAPRSSTWRRWGVTLANTVGILDEDYCGPEDECRLLVYRPARHNANYSPTMIPAGTRIAQGVFVPITRTDFEVVDGAIAATRGGWGSTGD